MNPLPGNPNLPPGVVPSDLDGPECSEDERFTREAERADERNDFFKENPRDY